MLFMIVISVATIVFVGFWVALFILLNAAFIDEEE